MELDKITIINNEEIEKKINIVLRQTNYTYEKAKELLKINNYDEIKCIKEYLGIDNTEIVNKQKKILSVNQEIYKQFREKLTIDPSKIENINKNR